MDPVRQSVQGATDAILDAARVQVDGDGVKLLTKEGGDDGQA